MAKDLFEAKVHLLQSLAAPKRMAKGTVFEHPQNGTWHEVCPSEQAWHFRSNDGRYGATVLWNASAVLFWRTPKGLAQ